MMLGFMKSFKVPSIFNSLQLRFQAGLLIVILGVVLFFGLLTWESKRLTNLAKNLEESAEISDFIASWSSELLLGARERTKYTTLSKSEYLDRFRDCLSRADSIFSAILRVGLREELGSTQKFLKLQENHINYKQLLQTVLKYSRGIDRNQNELFKSYELEIRDGLTELQITLSQERKQELVNFETSMANMKRRLILSMMPLMIVLALVLLMLDLKVFHPISSLERAAAAVGEGNLGLQVRIRNQDEIGRLTKVFNQMSTQLKVKQDDQVKLDKLEAISHVVRSVNHEINNPLMIISGNAEFLNMMLDNLDNSMRAKLDGIIHEVNRISSITKRLKEIREPVTENYTGDNDQMIDLARASSIFRREDVL